MIGQILISKRLFSIGESYSKHDDSLSAGLAISLFQDAIEQLIWCIAKQQSIPVRDHESFTSLLDKIEKSTPDGLPHKAKILELNKARTGFKHYGNLPASSESDKFRSYTYDFLVVASQRYLDTDFEKVSLASLIRNTTVRNHIQNAEDFLAEGNAEKSLVEVALARFFLFKELDQYIPKVDHNLRDADALFDQALGMRSRGIRVFQYLTNYLGEITRFNTAALAGGNIGEHLYFERVLPHVNQFMNGETQVSYFGRVKPTVELAARAIKYVVETAVRLTEIS